MRLKKMIQGCIILLMICLCPLPVPAAEWESEINVYLKTRFEFAENEDNINLFSYFDYDLKDKQDNSPRFHFSGWLRKDLYSEDNEAEYDTIEITQAFAKYKFLATNLELTAGRHTPGRVETYWIDGVQLGISKGKNAFSLYGGKPVVFYEVDYDEDLIAGFSLQLNHQWGTQFNLDTFFVKQSSQWYDNLIASLYHFIPEYSTRAYARIRAYELKMADLFFKLSIIPREKDTTVSVDYFLQNESDDESSDHYLGYNNVFGQRYGYQKFSISLQQMLWDTIFLNAQITLKRSVNDTEKEYDWMNLDSNIYTLGLTKYNFFHPDLSLGFFANSIDNQDNDFYDVSGIIDYTFKKRHNISGGVTYTGYSYGNLDFSDSLNDQDSVYEFYGHVGSKIYFLEYDLKIKKNQKMSIQLAHEDNDEPYQDATIVNLKYRYHF